MGIYNSQHVDSDIRGKFHESFPVPLNERRAAQKSTKEGEDVGRP